MAKKYLSLGIDHGTCNSSIAVMDGSEPRIVKVNTVDEIMPSVVYINKRGNTEVGAAAYRAMMHNDESEGNGYSGYKLRIGQDEPYVFSAANKKLSAQELGGIVIGALLRAYQKEGGNTPIGAVITVPAKFEHSACDGTRTAAQLAGLKFYPLLQEPIAAAIGYGFSTQNDHARFMVFDLGGGTLDVSLIFVREGEFFVPEEGHAGDNRLGGKKFDREILSYVLDQLKKTYSLDTFSENSNKNRSAWGKLLIACETAKIHLSSRNEAIVEVDGVLCKDDAGNDVKVEVPISRSLYESMIKTDIDKAIHICQTLLSKNRMSPKDLDHLLLVGGPTKTPYIRKALSDALGVKVDTSVDPMTAVARGAAIYASAQEVPSELIDDSVELSVDTTTVQLEYERVSKLTTCFVAGKVEGPALEEEELSVEIVRSDGRWSSSILPLDEDGCFETDLKLIDDGKPCMSKFTTRVLDKSGRIVVSIEEPEIWFRYPEGKARLANSLRVAVAGNNTEILVKQGAALPAEGWERFVTQKALRRGSSDDVLRIPVLEGVTHIFGDEDDHADCNIHVGTLTIHGDDQRVKFDIPENTEVEISIKQDSSREVHCVAYIQLLDEEFEATLKRESFDVDLESLERRFEILCITLEEAEELHKKVPISSLNEKFEKVRDLHTTEEITKELQRAKQGETDAFHRAYLCVLVLAGAINQIREIQREARVRRRMDNLKNAVDSSDSEALAEIRSEFKAAMDNNDNRALVKIENSLDEMDARVRRRPYNDLLLDVIAINGTRVNNEQNAAFKEADNLLNQINDKGGVESLTESDLSRLEAAHQKMVRLYGNLFELRQKALDDLPPGESAADLGAHLRKAGPQTH